MTIIYDQNQLFVFQTSFVLVYKLLTVINMIIFLTRLILCDFIFQAVSRILGGYFLCDLYHMLFNFSSFLLSRCQENAFRQSENCVLNLLLYNTSRKYL